MLGHFRRIDLGVFFKHVGHQQLMIHQLRVGDERSASAVGIERLSVGHSEQKKANIVQDIPEHRFGPCSKEIRYCRLMLG
mmetsp:Transcript_7662/g.21161  ORF Transcript_7662/g.21161 Transcript_7662/m.21161 type:complete len:80 (+) Transcript_7662:821-1060(+)